MKLAFLILTAFSFTGCSWFKSASVQAALQSVVVTGCNEQTAILKGLSGSVANSLNCTAPDEIQKSLTSAMGNVNLCKYVPQPQAGMPMKGIVGNIVCPIAVSTAIGFMTSAIPKEWGCTVTGAADKVQVALTAICEGAVPL
jgi:hypothetical protein